MNFADNPDPLQVAGLRDARPDTMSEAADIHGDEHMDPRRESVLKALEDIVFGLLRQLEENIHGYETASDAVLGGALKRIEIGLSRRDGTGGHRVVSWPKGNNSSRTMARLLRIVDMCHEAVAQGVIITKREIFYHDVALFEKQSVVDNLLDDLSATLQVSRIDLNVVASPKGLFCGSGIAFRFHSHHQITLLPTEASLIPVGREISDIIVSKNRFGWVLVVEKEAIFQTLCSNGLANSPLLSRHGLIITGRGQPDTATRNLLSVLSSQLRGTIPILILVDGDPYGFEIASVYKFGSVKMKHAADELVCPRGELLGICMGDINRFGISRDLLLPMSERDVKKALDMLRRDPTVMPTSWKSEITRFLRIRRKAELEVLSSLTFPKLPRPFCGPEGSNSVQNVNARPELLQTWNALEDGPLIVPFVISKLSEYLPPLA